MAAGAYATSVVWGRDADAFCGGGGGGGGCRRGPLVAFVGDADGSAVLGSEARIMSELGE